MRIHTPDDGCEPPPYESDNLYSGWTEHENEVEVYELIIDGHIDGELPNDDPRTFSCGTTVPVNQTDAVSEALEVAGFCPACGEQGGHEFTYPTIDYVDLDRQPFSRREM